MSKLREAPLIMILTVVLTFVFITIYIAIRWAFFNAPGNLETMLNAAANISMNTSWYAWYHGIQQSGKMMLLYGLAIVVVMIIVLAVVYLLDKKDEDE